MSSSSQPPSPKKDPATPNDPLRDAGGGDTKVEQGGDSAPRLPHERDQSADSQEAQDGQHSQMGRKGHDDVERGVVDTSRGAETDRVYNDKLRR
ncbi:hypothetical protein M2165_002417 [Variovorax sp. TBS-050B]|uniref:hypothetical protein n=1 Tax=Variovorax sp. TBS-050B TaxID=2940551 RepID=UPI0024745D67|nr:hypothetical protein [Variovorax sp. TBS-050B]MDH6592528.1 hypothetical protein [Variovorax sp. TBS-050B]